MVATGGWSGFIAASLSAAAGCLLVAVKKDAVVAPAGRGPLAGDSGEAPSAGVGRGAHPVWEGLLRVVRLICFRACGPMIRVMLSVFYCIDHAVYFAGRAALVCPRIRDAKRGITLKAIFVVVVWLIIKLFLNLKKKAKHVLSPFLHWRAGDRALVGIMVHPQLRVRRAPVE